MSVDRPNTANTERGSHGDGDSTETPVLCANGLEKTYGSGLPLPFVRTVEVLDGADVEIYPGEIVGIVGENGSGKSTLMEILVGALQADTGSVSRETTIGWCPQEPHLYDRLTVRETFRLFGTAYGMDGEKIETVRDEYADRLGFERFLDYRVDHLSGGNCQKVNLSIALMHDPDVLMLDEPYTGFDWETYLAFWELTEELTDDGTAIAIISHFVSERDRFDRILELADGRLTDVTGQDPTGRAENDPRGEGANGGHP